jgi:hypothetical protein
VVAEALELGNGSTRFSSLVAAPGHAGLIRDLPPGLFPQDHPSDLRDDAPLQTVGNGNCETQEDLGLILIRNIRGMRSSS